jgi:hypothetical protein
VYFEATESDGSTSDAEISDDAPLDVLIESSIGDGPYEVCTC